MRRLLLPVLLLSCSQSVSSLPDSGYFEEPDTAEESDADTDADTDTDGELVFNEICPKPSEGDDWFELAWRGEGIIELEDYGLTDAWGDGDEPYTLPDGVVMGPGGYLLLLASGEDEGLEVDFSLDAEGETLTLLDPDGTVLDRVPYPELDDDETYARTAEGAWEIVEDGGTPGAAN